MRKHKKIRNKKIALPPGSLVYVGDADIKHLDTLKITQTTYAVSYTHLDVYKRQV